MNNIEKLKELYGNRVEDRSFSTGMVDVNHLYIHIGDTVISVIQELLYGGTDDLEYAIIKNGQLMYLPEFEDSVARFQTIEEVIQVADELIKRSEQHETRTKH